MSLVSAIVVPSRLPVLAFRVSQRATTTMAGIAGVVVGANSTLSITTEGTVTSASGVGVFAASNGDDNIVTIKAMDSITGETGIVAALSGDNTALDITTDGAVSATNGSGIFAATIGKDGSVDITTNGTVDAAGSGVVALNTGGSTNIQIGDKVNARGLFGSFALGGGTGFANIEIDGGIIGADVGAAAVTIGSGDATVTANEQVSAGALGLGALNIGSGNVRITNTARILSDGIGIAAAKFGTSGDVTVSVNDDIGGLSGSATGGDGVLAISATSGAGAVDVTVADGVSITSDTIAVNALKLTGEGDVMVSLGKGDRLQAGAVGVNASSLLGDGNVRIKLDEDVGIEATAGIVATKVAGSGEVDVLIGDRSTISAGVGVVAANLADAGNVSVITGQESEIQAYNEAIVALSRDGNTNVETGGESLTVSLNASAIVAAGASSVTVTTDGTIAGAGENDSAVVDILSGNGAVFTNNGFVSALDEDESKLALNAQGGSVTVNNDGQIVGRVGLSANDDTLINNGNWFVSGISDFGAGFDRLSNLGGIRTSFTGNGGEYAEFANLDYFNNNGILTMQGETAGLAFNAARDLTVAGGDYTGTGNSTLAIDAYLGQYGSTSDVLRVEGNTAGHTLLNIRDMNTGPGAYNPEGISIVEVSGLASSITDFTIDPASANAIRGGNHVIDKGLFFYDVALVDVPVPTGTGMAARFAAPGGQEFRLIGAVDHEAFELPVLATGAQTIWNETSGIWLDRQGDLRSQLGNAETLPEGYVSKDGPVTAPPANGVTPGVWVKAVGNWTSRDAGTRYSIANNTYSFDTSYKQNTFGLIGGVDFGTGDVLANDDTLIFGLLGGYLKSSLDFRHSPTSFEYSGGTVGAYATYINKGFFIDTLFKADLLKVEYNTPTLGFDEKPKANTYGFLMDTGYRFELPNELFIEPVATLSYARTSIGDLNDISGAAISFGHEESFRGSLGARFGGQVLQTESYRVEASLTGRVWDEFKNTNSAYVQNIGVPLTVEDNFKGVFGEVGGTVNVFDASDKWSSFVSGTYKFNGDIKSGTVRGGIRFHW
ncbi:autotransporter outer membrane beta-barrel domain-containing protein [Brucella thiophenivorans]|uniref:autotransporter outer membrane beta-barrel domain-containing protein n=1 Tax=Brucella thiophenivorans TaxID=571255 RepID=UPI001F2DB2A3|nr:autotransporter outer membrane beta-barrel domain-containing protein [Brucella thiophenivorans]